MLESSAESNKEAGARLLLENRRSAKKRGVKELALGMNPKKAKGSVQKGKKS